MASKRMKYEQRVNYLKKIKMKDTFMKNRDI